jgi:transposase-like protein/IS1 family transposase
MQPHNCLSTAKRFGFDRYRNQRFRCHVCKKTWSEAKPRTLGTMRINEAKGLMAIQLLVEGCSIRSIERITGIGKAALLRLLVLAGERCQRVMAEKIRNVNLEYVEADEIWGYVFKKEGHKYKPEEIENTKIGDAYTFVAIEGKSKLVACYELGRRDIPTALRFTDKLQRAASGRFQLTTDGLKAYVEAVEQTFGADIDFAQLVKKYKSDEDGNIERRYSPGDFVSAKKVTITGNPELDKVSTSYVERQNLTMRMMMRRLTRLTNAFSKKWENLDKALSLHFAYYNFCRVHKTLRVTPAMEAGITNHVWSIAELLTA